MKKEADHESNISAVCKICSKTLKGSLHATTNFLNHIKVSIYYLWKFVFVWYDMYIAIGYLLVTIIFLTIGNYVIFLCF